MAYGKRTHLTTAMSVALAAAICAFALSSAAIAEHQPYKRHFTSQESQRRNEQRRASGLTGEAPRRWKVSKDRISSLKKSSFWNKKPYQFSTPLVADGKLFIGADAGRFYAFALPRAKKLWEIRTEGPVQSRAEYSEGSVFVGDAKGVFYSLNAEDGAVRWSQKLDTEILAAPLVAGSRVYVSTMSGRLYALDAGSGSEHWHTDTSEREFGFSVRRAAAPVYSNGLIYQGTSTGDIRAIRESDGSIAWVRKLGNMREMVYDVDSTPLLYENRLYTASADGALYALNPGSGSVDWTSEGGGVGDIRVHEGRLYSSGGGSLYALDPATGKIFWQQDLEKPAISSPAAGQGFIAVVSTTDKIFIIESETGDIAYERFVKKGSFGDPFVHENKVYMLSNSGKLYSFKVERRHEKEKKPKKSGKSVARLTHIW
ncbi:MAG: PQQ-binding-like beta-propeller repeat protein [bacterium]